MNTATFRCPRDLTKNFIDGTLGDEAYTKTFLRVYACDENDEATSSKSCMETTQRDKQIQNLRIQFIYLETNFEGANIQNPLVSYLTNVLPVGLDARKTEQVSISLDQNIAITNDSYLSFSQTMD